LVYTGKYVTEDKSKTDTKKLNTTQKKTNTKHSKTKLAWVNRFLGDTPRKQGGLFYSIHCSSAHMVCLTYETDAGNRMALTTVGSKSPSYSVLWRT